MLELWYQVGHVERCRGRRYRWCSAYSLRADGGSTWMTWREACAVSRAAGRQARRGYAELQNG